MTGIELIQLASEQHGLQYRLGYGGNVVCQLGGVGYDSDECLKEGPEFWGYWRGDGSGGWEWSSSGGQATTVRDGDVEGWAWGTGNDGATHPAPPETTFASVCGEKPSGGAEPPDPGEGKIGSDDSPEERAGEEASRDTSEVTDKAPTRPDEKPQPDDRKPNKERENVKREKDRNEGGRNRIAQQSSTPSPNRSVVAPTATGPASSDAGPPLGGVVALVAAVAAIGAGLAIQRRRLRTR